MYSLESGDEVALLRYIYTTSYKIYKFEIEYRSTLSNMAMYMLLPLHLM